jgi:hypothetical protein
MPFFQDNLNLFNMKARQFIGGFIAIIGMTAAVSVADGSAHEMLVRGIGVALFAIGAFVGKFFDFQKAKSHD